jgi:hypothetical protein
MKCRQCSKVIPDGFTDCPWCGATSATPRGLATGQFGSSGAAASASQNLLIAISLLSSGVLFGALNYFVALRTTGPLTPENSGYLLGRGVGLLALAFLLVFVYYKIRKNRPRAPIQVLVCLTLSSLLTLLSLAIPVRSRVAGMKAAARQYGGLLKHQPVTNAPPVVQTKWDPAARALMKDIFSRNQQYVSEISALDETAQPLYTVESFRNATTVQQMISQLQARLAVADKYTDWAPVFARMKGYVDSVNASEDEKRRFMVNYESSLPKTLAACKAITDKEHAWLKASLDLYQFALAKDGAYVWQNGNLSFKNHADSDLFRQKFAKARALNEEFLRAYWEVRSAQEAMLAQLGLQDSDFDPSVGP